MPDPEPQDQARQPDPTRSKKRLAVIGTVIGFLALTCSLLSPWIAEAIDPPPPPAEAPGFNFSFTFNDKTVGNAPAPASVSAPPKPPSYFLMPAIIAAGMIGAGFGFGSLITGEPRSLATTAIALGIGAAVAQWVIIIAAAIIVLLILGYIISAIGLDLPGV